MSIHNTEDYPPTDDQLRTLWALIEDYTGETTVGQRMRKAWDYVAGEIQSQGRTAIAECNWTCARASTCHEYECDGESHFVPKKNSLVDKANTQG